MNRSSSFITIFISCLLLVGQLTASCGAGKAVSAKKRAASKEGKGPWKGKSCAVVLTYDDALNVHLDNAVPALDSLDFKATFYLSGNSPAINNRIPEWKTAALKGHELGNHTLYHPCASEADRSFVQPDYDLRSYTVNRMVNEIRMNNTLLKSIDGKRERTFAYPCGDTHIGDTAYIDFLRKDFTGARSVRTELPKISEVDLYYVPCYMINGQSGEEMISLVKQAMSGQRMLVFLFHGVGGEHSLNVSQEAHDKLLQFLKQNEQDIWVAPMTEVASFIKDYKEAGKDKMAGLK